MKDEEYLFRSDCRDKKNIARSARNKRTHNGKSGRVKFPSDYLSKKELQKMNGEVKSYRLNDPMKFAEFKTMPDDLKVSYIRLIREKFFAPDLEIAKMLGVHPVTFSGYVKTLGVTGKKRNGKKKWDKEGFLAWCNGTPIPAADPAEETTETVEQSVDEAQETERQIASLEEICDPVPVPVPVPEIKALPVDKQKNKAIPDSGSMTFEGSVESILNTLSVLLGGANAHISITWDVLSDDAG